MTVEFLMRQKGLGNADAYALASLAVDFSIGEAVDIVNLVYAIIPKALFRNNPGYWNNETAKKDWGREAPDIS